jgi:hypothetical protein
VGENVPEAVPAEIDAAKSTFGHLLTPLTWLHFNEPAGAFSLHADRLDGAQHTPVLVDPYVPDTLQPHVRRVGSRPSASVYCSAMNCPGT